MSTPSSIYPAAERFGKYLVLLFMLFITTIIVFDGFSYYIARRSLDAELESKGRKSLEYLVTLARRERALSVAALETRCRERNELAVYSMTNSALANFTNSAAKAYKDAFQIKQDLVNYLERHGQGVVDVPNSQDNIRQTKWQPSKESFVAALVPIDGDPAKADQSKLDKLLSGAAPIIDRFKTVYEANRDLFTALPLGAASLDTKSIDVLEQRAKRIAAEHAKNVAEFNEFDELVSRYNAWTAALAGSKEALPLQEMYYELTNDEASRLDKLNCKNLEASYTIITGKPFDVSQQATARNGGWLDWYRDYKADFFGLPTIAQTLFVTLFLGALGALTLNVLRLSKVGWWGSLPDPEWGELWASPLLGALAAFGIFLIGTAGLLLTNDVRGAQGGGTSLSAFFIGLLGFISGLLYDQAFGNVRRVGERIFATAAAGGADPDDRALADLLRQNGASLASELVLTFRLGARLKAEKEFTFFVPDDDAINALALGDWRDISSKASSTSFDRWYHHHHAGKKFDAASLSEGGAIQMDDSEVLKVASAQGSVTIQRLDATGAIVKQANIKKPDLPWGEGFIHIIAGDI
ncbi:fasciclin domain-containing protein [Bradyrhizobium manausense]|uniref:fasciclin domain-containing protein n=1 Tax=Bradyrhizobium manausense TaxID=989370 RepID=UPI001BAAA48F|nr:fasciclin domain-containing protein [Bradyrhizobium manausense]MBR0684426.1 fasciclin domain-containing protein [Bradyrhizobium manausense]